jgi:peptidyl-prolyl cis-trans isomerase SurA
MNKISISLVLAVSFLTANAQDPVVMEINGKPVLKSEFEAVYKKNSGKDVQNNTKSVKEYVDLFSLLKAKFLKPKA